MENVSVCLSGRRKSAREITHSAKTSSLDTVSEEREKERRREGEKREKREKVR